MKLFFIFGTLVLWYVAINNRIGAVKFLEWELKKNRGVINSAKKINIVFLCIILMLCGCQTLTYKIKDNKKELSPKEQILSAFSFWVNKENWLYDNSVYVDVQRNIKIYYKARNEAEYLGYIFIANGDKYDKIVFVINKNDGYQSEPLYVKQVKTIDGKLSYLGEK